MFGLIGHLTSLEHAQSVADDLGYPEYANQGLDFWCAAPPQIVDDFHVTSITGQTITGKYIESCFLPEMLSHRWVKSAIRKVLNAMHSLKKVISTSPHSVVFLQLFSRNLISKIIDRCGISS